MTSQPRLITRLADYDGKRVEVLERIRDEVQPSAPVLDEAIALGAGEDGAIAAGATWLLRAWIESGVELTSAQTVELIESLDADGDPWACLHICQVVGSLVIPESGADTVAAFLEGCRGSERPFLRAWATDGLYRLARQHSRFADQAERALEEATLDPAASVRARARRIGAEGTG